MMYVHIGPGCCCAGRGVLSLSSWHGLLWQRNKPAWPMITPTASRHLCTGEARLRPQTALTPSVSACTDPTCVRMACWVHDLVLMFSLGTSKCPCVYVCVCPSTGSVWTNRMDSQSVSAITLGSSPRNRTFGITPNEFCREECLFHLRLTSL